MPDRIAALIAVAFAALLAGAALLGAPTTGVAPSPSAAGTVLGTAQPAEVAPPAPVASRPIPDGYRVRVPRLRIDLPIAEGEVQRDVDQQRTPEGYAFHLPGTAIPGEPGNAYLYAHARTGMFLSLWDARAGDEVIVMTPEGRELAYVVTEVRPRVPPADVSVAQPTADERLTLQTSTGPGPSDPRFVVIALPRP